MGELTPFGTILRRLVAVRLDGRSSHVDGGAQPHSRQPPGCVGYPDPCAPEHHRACVLADRWARACALGNCQYGDAQAPHPDRKQDCPGQRGVRRLVGGRCVVTWPGPCDRRRQWSAVHDHHPPRPTTGRLHQDERAPWERAPGEDG